MTESRPTPETLVIDPIALKVVNRIADTCRLTGDLVFEGGLLLQGQVAGQVRVHGPLIVGVGGQIHGQITVIGDLYLMGCFGAAGEQASDSHLRCHGTVFVSHTGVCTGTLSARCLQTCRGADVQGPFHILSTPEDVPTLCDAVTG